MKLPATRPCARLIFAAALAAHSLPAVAETTTVNGIEVTGAAGFRLTVPAIEMEESSLGEDAVRALLTGDIAAEAGRLSQLDAAAIRIPELRLEYRLPGPDGAPQETVMVYRDFQLTGVVDGVAASAAIGSVELTGPEGAVLSFGRMSSGRLDIGGMLGFYGLGGRTGETEMRPVYSDFVFEGMKLTAPDVVCDIGATRVAEFSARPLHTPFDEILPLLQELEAQEQAGGQPDPETVAKAIAVYLDVFTAFRSSPTEFDGLACAGKDEDGKPLRITLGPVTIDGFEPGIYPGIALSGFRIDVTDEGWMELGSLTLRPMDFTAAIATLRQAATLDEAWFEANWRKLVPAFGGLSASGLGIDVPDPQQPGVRIAASVGAFDVSLSDYVNGIPATIGLSASDIVFALPPDAIELATLSLDRLDLGYDVSLHWDRDAGDIVVERFAVSDAGLGSIALGGLLGNATPDLFSDDIGAAAAAAMGLTLKRVDIEIADNGLTGLLIALAAREQEQEPAAFRAVLSGLAQALPLAALGPTEEATALGAELRAFIDGRPNLKLTLTAKDPAGISLAALEAVQQDPAILGREFTIVAAATGEPRPVLPAVPVPAPRDDAADADGGVSPHAIEKRKAKRATLGM